MDIASSVQAATPPVQASPVSGRVRDGSNRAPRPHGVLAAILIAAFVLRVAGRVYRGNDDFWANGYSFFYDLATNLAHGSFQIGGMRAMRTPLYPGFLAATTVFGKYYLWIVVPQALMGA